MSSRIITIDNLKNLSNSDLRMVIKHEKEFNDHLNKKLSFLNERLDLTNEI